MSDVISQLATINFDERMLVHADVGNIYRDFNANYQRLDDLKNFRSDYEKKNKLMRWWHNDKLRDAQLDSAEVQAEFSKTIGQLMLIGIAQSKKLTQQQNQLNEQQEKLSAQAEGIVQQAEHLQMQQHTLAEQNSKLEKLVKDFFALKGFTEDGARKLIAIANDVRGTKDALLADFSVKQKRIEAIFSEFSIEINQSKADINTRLAETQNEIKLQLKAQQTNLNESSLALQNSVQELLQKTIDHVEIENKQLKFEIQQRCSGVEDRLAKIKEEYSATIEEVAANFVKIQTNFELTSKNLNFLKEEFLAKQEVLSSMQNNNDLKLNSQAILISDISEILSTDRINIESQFSLLREEHAELIIANEKLFMSLKKTILINGISIVALVAAFSLLLSR